MKHTTVVLAFSTAISLLSLSIGGAFAATMEEKVSERIKPIGSLCMVGDYCAAVAQPTARPLLSGREMGKQIYDTKCMMCHASGAAGAPVVGTNEASAAAWAPRMSKGIDMLFTNAISGINGMPAMGLCNDCIDNDIKVSVCHMINVAVPVGDITEEVKSTCAAIENSM